MRFLTVSRRRGRFLPALALATLLLGGSGTPAGAEDKAPESVGPTQEALADALAYAMGIERGLVKAVAKVRLNSVTVFNLKQAPNDGPLYRRSAGSGVIIQRKSKLWILTNVHVIAGNAGLEVVTHDGVVRAVTVHDSIPEYDIALLRFTEKPKRVKFRGVSVKKSKSGTGRNGLREGTWVLATGNPFWLASDGTAVATLGVVSGLNRFLPGKYSYVGAIQHDAEVNPGNSGGPLWNLNGDLVGINGKITMGHRIPGVGATNTGASFSLPIHQVEAFLKRLVGEGDAEAGFLGLVTETAVDGKGKAIGARVLKVHPQSPLRARGKKKNAPQPGDVISSITVKGSPKRVYTATDLREVLSLLSAGTEIILKFRSGSQRKRWKGALGDKRR